MLESPPERLLLPAVMREAAPCGATACIDANVSSVAWLHWLPRRRHTEPVHAQFEVRGVKEGGSLKRSSATVDCCKGLGELTALKSGNRQFLSVNCLANHKNAYNDDK